MPFYSHEIDAYWNDIGNLTELRESTYDALTGAVEVEQVGEMVDGFRSGEREGDEGELDGPVLLGPGCEIGDDVRIDGPAVIGDGARIGAGSRLRDVIVLPGAEVPERSVLIGAILGASRLSPCAFSSRRRHRDLTFCAPRARISSAGSRHGTASGRRRARRAAALRRLRADLPGGGGDLHPLFAGTGRGDADPRGRPAGDRPGLVLGIPRRRRPVAGRRAEVPPAPAGGRADGGPDPLARARPPARRRGRARSRRRHRACGAAASTRPASWRRRWRRGSRPTCRPAWPAEARAIRSAAAAPTGSAARRGSSRSPSPPAASSWSTTC